MGCGGSKPADANEPAKVVEVEPAPTRVAPAVEVDAVTLDETPPTEAAVVEEAPAPEVKPAANAPAPAARCPMHEPLARGEARAEAADWPRADPHAILKTLAFSRAQPAIADLLAEHASAIAALRAAIADVPEFAAGADATVKYDDVFLLRFILSNGAGTAETEAAVRSCIKWRAENAALLARAADGLPHPDMGEVNKFSYAELWTFASLADEPVQIIRAGKSNTHRWMDRFTADHVVETMNYQKEQAFLRADAATRRTGRLVKMVTVIDMHSSRLTDNDNRFFKALGRASKESELFYPQLLEMTVAINVPSYMNLLWPIAKRIMPAKTLAKFRICGARDTMKESAAKCPFATTVFTPETLVTFLGGSAASTDVLGPADRPRAP